MKYEKQFSEELEVLLSPLEAHNEWVQGNLIDKTAFSCKNPKCSAKFTCVNMDKFSKERVNSIHFRLVGEHVANCTKEMELERKANIQVIEDEQEARDSENGVDYLVLDSTSFTEPPKKKGTDENNDIVEKKKRALKDAKRKNSRNSRYHTILPMVINYLEYKRLGELDKYKVNNAGKEMYYKDFFFEFTDKKFDYWIKGNRIFHGKAKLKKVNSGYRLEFQTLINFRDLIRKPSVFISDIAIKSGWKYKLRGKDLMKLAETGEIFHAFVYGQFGVNKKEIDSYINHFPVINFPYDKKNTGKRFETINLMDYKEL